MTDRMDVLHGKERGDKTYWTKIGVAFPAKSGEGWNVILDYIPAGSNENGQVQMVLRPPKPKTPEPGSKYDQAPLDDDIPF